MNSIIIKKSEILLMNLDLYNSSIIKIEIKAKINKSNFIK